MVKVKVLDDYFSRINFVVKSIFKKFGCEEKNTNSNSIFGVSDMKNNASETNRVKRSEGKMGRRIK